jgi:hypothetical protein
MGRKMSRLKGEFQTIPIDSVLVDACYIRKNCYDIERTDVRQEKMEADPEAPECGGFENPVENNSTKRYFTRINREIDRIKVQVKSRYMERNDARQEREVPIQRLNTLSTEIRVNDSALKVPI